MGFNSAFKGLSYQYTSAQFPVGKNFAVRKELRVDTGNIYVGRSQWPLNYWDRGFEFR